MITTTIRFLVDREVPLKTAMQRLEETEERILFVCEPDGTLFGSLTDGDIRRWILAEGSLGDPVARVCNRHPFTMMPGYTLEEVRREMLERNIACVPVLSSERRIVELLFWGEVFREQAQIRPPQRQIDVPVVIMAGGKGTRLEPFTRVLPKPLIPVNDKTIIELIIESFTDFGIRDFLITVNHKAKVIKAFFEDLEVPYRVRFLEEPHPLGTAGCLRLLAGKVEGAIMVTNCDIIVRADYADLLETHVRGGHDITMVASIKSYPIPYGVCELGPEGRLSRIVEKPRYDLLVNTGMYVIDAKALDLIPEERMFHATDLVGAVLARGGRVGVYPVGESAWFDIGEWAEYQRTVAALSAHSPRPPSDA
jgi:dTDP-glucose pyrophosphorylase